MNGESIKEYYRLLLQLGMLGSPDGTAPSIDDAKSVYFTDAEKIGLRITKFNKIGGSWELEGLVYKMEVAVEGILNESPCKHTETVRFHRISKGWEIELPIFSLCGIRKNEVKFEPIILSDTRKN
jgi:hypothetical protein